MQFKHPEVLYFLALLIIPILVHLFQLQRYKKVPFTNVAFLQKIAIDNRKSSRIKKWLILLTRLSLLAAIIIAFAQPYFGKNNINTAINNFIYLDNSLSTNSNSEKGNILQTAIQEIISSLKENNSYTLLTNTNYYENVTAADAKELLLKTKNTAKKQPLKEVLLKVASSKNQKNNTSRQNIFISDFQNTDATVFSDVATKITLVQQIPEQKDNISIDSVFITENNNNNLTINALIKNQGIAKNNLPIAILNNEKLISKQTFSVDENTTKKVSFSVEKTALFLGKLSITFEDAYAFDNHFYFSVNNQEKTNVLAIGNDNNFLSRIYTENEFNFTDTKLKNVNYNNLEKQQLIVLNELESIPVSLQNSLNDFTTKGGQLIIIPNENTAISSYNLLFKSLSVGNIKQPQKDSLKITNINYKHPLFKNVFDKNVRNFQYPNVKSYYPDTFKNASNLISFENNDGFIKQINLNNGKLFWVASPLNKSQSNFTNSPLIVPVFYNIGQQSLQLSKLHYYVDDQNIIEIQTTLGKDNIVTIQNDKTSFIPLQQNNQHKITVTTKDQPLENGFYTLLHKKDTLNTIAFNYPKQESNLQFLELIKVTEKNKNLQFSTSIEDTLQKMNKKNEVQWLWKWFLILAIVSLLLEILILKYFKV